MAEPQHSKWFILCPLCRGDAELHAKKEDGTIDWKTTINCPICGVQGAPSQVGRLRERLEEMHTPEARRILAELPKLASGAESKEDWWLSFGQ